MSINSLAGGREATEQLCWKQPDVLTPLEYQAGQTECPKGQQLLHRLFSRRNHPKPNEGRWRGARGCESRRLLLPQLHGFEGF
jgi:hypothetical protein